MHARARDFEMTTRDLGVKLIAMKSRPMASPSWVQEQAGALGDWTGTSASWAHDWGQQVCSGLRSVSAHPTPPSSWPRLAILTRTGTRRRCFDNLQRSIGVVGSG